MCGFVGFSGVLENKKQILNKMMGRIIHRGPDSEGGFIDDDIALGFRRLSIIDLEGGSQPIYNEDGSIAIVYNGETYNFPELRRELVADGHVFKTDSDTEVLVHGYEKYGEDVISAFDFAKRAACVRLLAQENVGTASQIMRKTPFVEK